MAKAIEQLQSGLTVGRAALGLRGGVTGSVRRQAHDGDTLNVRPGGNFGMRFLGVDAPEISFTLPAEERFTGLADPRWDEFLRDPFALTLPPFDPPLTPGLLRRLQPRTGPETALNHHRRAVAEDALEQAVLDDLAALGQTPEDFRFFLAFASGVIDRYGRLLRYINRLQVSATQPAPRPDSYNERLLQAARIRPYFVRPNVNPFRRRRSVAAAVFPPGAARAVADREVTLRRARDTVRAARQQQIGLFNTTDPLRLQRFEARFPARRRPPDRWVIDLSKDDRVALQPQQYHTIPRPEDHLFTPEEYVPLFVEAGCERLA